MNVEATIPDTLEIGNNALNWLWEGLTPEEKIYAAALAQTMSEEELISENVVNRILESHATRLHSREVKRAAQDLIKRRVLEKIGKDYIDLRWNFLVVG